LEGVGCTKKLSIPPLKYKNEKLRWFKSQELITNTSTAIIQNSN